VARQQDPRKCRRVDRAARRVPARGGRERRDRRRRGEILHNYVSPDARFRGVSRALLAALESRAAERGARQCRLESTETAHRFYRAAGYADDGPPIGKFGVASGYRMTKALAAPRS